MHNKKMRLSGAGICLLVPKEGQFNTTRKNQHKENQRVSETKNPDKILITYIKENIDNQNTRDKSNAIGKENKSNFITLEM